ncbi:hypothetical protein BJX61DRAFT_296190 [Aspergillus egyptiacus]|nr:hypothetical protein BJX61DRAFT_296190 [Aspergillus egyptiacus]
MLLILSPSRRSTLPIAFPSTITYLLTYLPTPSRSPLSLLYSPRLAMAGVKRRHDAVQSSTTSSTHTSAAHGTSREPAGNDSPSTRVTRNLRSSRDARASQNDNVKNANNTSATSSSMTPGNQTSATNNASKQASSRPSRVVKLKYGPGLLNSSQTHGATPETPSAPAPTSSVPTSTRETRNSRARAAASATPAVPAAQTSVNRVDGAPSFSAVPETPRTRRVKRGSVAEETPRTTRQSARLKGTVNETPTENGISETPAQPKPLDASPLAPAATKTRTRNRNRHVADPGADEHPRNRPTASATKSPSPEDVSEPNVTSNQVTDEHPPDAEPTLPAGESPKATASSDSPNIKDGKPVSDGDEEPKPTSTRSSPILSRKRKSLESGDRNAVLSTTTSPSKKPKLEDAAAEPVLQNGDVHKQGDAPSLPNDALDSRVDEGSRQITEEADGSITPDNTTEVSIAKATRGGRNRGRGRGARNRTSARFGGSRRGRGGTRAARSGRSGRQNDRSSDIEFERSPSPTAATQRLRDRQRELDKAFRRVAAAQRLALAVLATQSEKRLARDKNAHKNVPEYEEINLLLKAQLKERQETIRHEYDLKVAQENRLFQANKKAIEDRYLVSASYIQEEHLLASHGEYMTFIEGRRAAEDDEHTETDGSEPENDRGRRAPVSREVYRGFTSSFVRDPTGAAAYERAAFGWDDFVQRAKLGDDIDPQMKEMGDPGPLAGCSADEIIQMLLDATGIVEVRDGVTVKEHHPPGFMDARAAALTALADVATTAEAPRPPLSQPTPRLASHRAILPQPPQPPPPIHHAHPEPRPFVLPPPTPRGQPRRLLPAGQQIPPINAGEPLALPDPFSSRGGPPQLPPPPGSNFQRPPLPGFMASHPHPSLYYPPPPPPPRPPY